MERSYRVLGFMLVSITLNVNFCAEAVEIRRLSVPKWVQNGTDFVILDCEYVYNENDIRLVVKWFFNDNLEPVYQWIPELNMRHTSGILHSRLDTDFSVNTVDAYSRYRALKILDPTTELSGKYTCLVTSLAGQDSREQNLTVYVPATTFDVNYIESGHDVNVTCEAEGLYPRPTLRLYLLSSEETTRQQMDAVRTVNKELTGVYNISLRRSIPSHDLPHPDGAVFECQLEIPSSGYSKNKKVAYYRGIVGSVSDLTGHMPNSGKMSILRPPMWITTLAIIVPMVQTVLISAIKIEAEKASPVC